MPTFLVSTPTGRQFEVDGADENEAISSLQSYLGGEAAPQQRTRLTPEMIDAYQQSLGAPALNQSAVSDEDLKKGFADYEHKPGFLESLGSGAKRSFSQAGVLQDQLLSLGAKGLGYDDYAKQKLDEAAAKQEEIQQTNPAQFESYKDVNWSNLPAYAGESIGEQAFNALAVLGTGVGVGAIGKKLATSAAEKAVAEMAAQRAATGAAEAAAPAVERLIAREAAKGAEAGTNIGMYLGSFGLNAGDTYQGIYDETGEMAPGAAAIGASINGFLESIVPARFVKALRETPTLRAEVAARIAAGKGVAEGLLPAVKAGAMGSLKGGVLEPITEVGQEIVNKLAEDIVGESQEKWGSEDFDRFINSAAKSIAPGMLFGFGEGVGKQANRRAVADRLEQQQQVRQFDADQLAAEEERKQQLYEGIPELEQQVQTLTEALNLPENRARAGELNFNLREAQQQLNDLSQELTVLEMPRDQRAQFYGQQQQEEEVAPEEEEALPTAPAPTTVQSVLEPLGISFDELKAAKLNPNAPLRGNTAQRVSDFIDQWRVSPNLSLEQAQAADALLAEHPELQSDAIGIGQREDREAHLATAPDLVPKKAENWYKAAQQYGLTPESPDAWQQLSDARYAAKSPAVRATLTEKLKADFPEQEQGETDRVAALSAQQRMAEEQARAEAVFKKAQDATYRKQVKDTIANFLAIAKEQQKKLEAARRQAAKEGKLKAEQDTQAGTLISELDTHLNSDLPSLVQAQLDAPDSTAAAVALRQMQGTIAKKQEALNNLAPAWTRPTPRPATVAPPNIAAMQTVSDVLRHAGFPGAAKPNGMQPTAQLRGVAAEKLANFLRSIKPESVKDVAQAERIDALKEHPAFAPEFIEQTKAEDYQAHIESAADLRKSPEAFKAWQTQLRGGYKLGDDAERDQAVYRDLRAAQEIAQDHTKKQIEKYIYSSPPLKKIVAEEQEPAGPLAEVRESRAESATRETIDVDGVKRPTMNSEGRPIHTTENGIRNFWRWFGDSKIVDAQGRPLVVYHGTKANFSTFDIFKTGTASDAGWYGDGFYFSPDPLTASGYAANKDPNSLGFQRISEGSADVGGNVMPSYLRILNPYDWRSENVRGLIQNTASASIQKRAELISRGYDGVLVFKDFIQLAENENLSDTQWDALTSASPEVALLGRKTVTELFRAREWTYRELEQAYGVDVAHAMNASRSRRILMELVAFNPEQIKSATGNAGTFSKYSTNIKESRQTEGSSTKPTPEQVRKVIEERMGASAANVVIARTPKEAGVDNVKGIHPLTKGAVIKGKAYLFTDNMRVGKEFGVFLHEVGDHLGMKKLVGEGNYNFLVSQVQKWADKNDGSLESKIARAAMERIPQGTKKESELLAYFIEEAVDNYGVNPSEIRDTATPLGLFFRKILAGIKNILNKLGLSPKDLTSQDIVNLAYGAAQLELSEGTVQEKSATLASIKEKGVPLNDNFWKFYGGSKLLSEDKKPIMMYTGTSKDVDFKSFKVPKRGAWFSNDTELASQYALGNESMDLKYDFSTRRYNKINTKSRVIPVYLNIENPKIYSGDGKEMYDEIHRYGGNGVNGYKRGEAILFDILRSQGYDGVVIGSVEDPLIAVVLKDANQIKSVFNKGDWNPKSKDTLLSLSTEIQFTIDELIKAAKSQKTWKDWYTRYQGTLDSLFGSDAPLFKKLLSATSQAASVPANVGLAIKAYRQLLAGEPFVGYLPAVIKNLDRIKNEEDLRGQKIGEYAKANAGDEEGIAVDRHIARLFFDTDRPTAKQVAVAKERIIQIAKRLKWKPSEVQAALWAFNQVRTGKDPSKVVSYDTILLKKLQQINAIRAQYGRGESASVPASGTVVEGNYGAEADTDGTGEDGEVSVRESRAPSPSVLTNGTPQAQQQFANYGFGRMDTVMRNTPQWGKATMGKALGELSNMPTSARKFVYYAAQLPQMADMVEKYSPGAATSIRDLSDVLAARKTRADKRKTFIEKILLDGKAAAEAHTPAQLAKFEEVTHNLSREQIDPWDTANKAHPLYKQFHSLPKPLQDVFNSVVAAYRQFGDEYLDHMEKIAGPAFTPAMKMQYKMRMKRIMPYLPLFREGDFWVAYTDRNGDSVVRACDTDLERSQVMRAAHAAGATDIQPFKQIADINPNNVKPTREFAQILNLMQTKGVDEAVQAKVYQTLLQMFPAKSIMQQFRPRKGTLGYREDILRNFAVVGSRMADNLTQFEFTKDIDNVYKNLDKELLKSERSGDDVAIDMLNEMKQREQFLRYPVNSKYANFAASASYNQFLLGNISSSIMNSTSLVMSTMPVLGGKYGYPQTIAAMGKALSMYAKGGRDDNTSLTIFGRRLSDKTFMGDSARGKALAQNRPDLKKLFDTAVSRQAIHRSVGLELHDMKKMALKDYTGSWMKIKTLLSWLFQNSERMNREVTLLAAYQLEMDDLAKRGIRGDVATNQAIDKAIKAITFTQGVATPELGSRALQSNIGKVIGTFKKYPMTQLYMVGTLFNEAIRGASAKEKQIAQKQLLGIMGMGWAFAGVKGLPLVGGISFLAEMILGDEDDPFDIDQWALESMGNLGWNGLVSDMTGLRISDRAAIGSFFREDKKRLEELGWQWYLAEQTIGAPASLVKNWIDASELFQQGYTLKAAERALPLFMSNAIKAVDQGVNGIVTKDGVKIADDPSLKDLISQGIGFRSETTARAQDVNTIENQITTAVNARRIKVLNNLWRFRNDPEKLAEARQAKDDFNRSRYGQLPKNRITPETIEKSKKQHKVVDKAAAGHYGMAPDQKYKAAFRELEESVSN